jgi:hypothetical protein
MNHWNSPDLSRYRLAFPGAYMRSLLLVFATWLGPSAFLSGDEPRQPTPEQRAVAYLSHEVPRWKPRNKCYSCHNNGDAARALYAAVKQGMKVPATSLADNTVWLNRPDRWDASGGDKEFSDKKLARIQFAAALATSREAGQVKDRKPLGRAARMVADDQHKDGSWPIDAGGNIGSPITYGTALATALARQVLRQNDSRRYRPQIARADQWLRKTEVKNVLHAAGVLLGLAGSRDDQARAQQDKCLALIRKGQGRDGGWGPYVTAASEPFDTALVLLALCPHAEKSGVKAMIRRGRAYLVANQDADGSWPATTRPAGRSSYAQHISTTAWATIALLATRK